VAVPLGAFAVAGRPLASVELEPLSAIHVAVRKQDAEPPLLRVVLVTLHLVQRRVPLSPQPVDEPLFILAQRLTTRERHKDWQHLGAELVADLVRAELVVPSSPHVVPVVIQFDQSLHEQRLCPWRLLMLGGRSLDVPRRQRVGAGVIQHGAIWDSLSTHCFLLKVTLPPYRT
jgi:hypothetical protein